MYCSMYCVGLSSFHFPPPPPPPPPYVCKWVCVCVCVLMYVCVCVCARARAFVCKSVFFFPWATPARLFWRLAYVCIYVCICMQVRTFVCTYLCKYVCMFEYYTWVHTADASVCMHTCMPNAEPVESKGSRKRWKVDCSQKRHFLFVLAVDWSTRLDSLFKMMPH
jgi:hypothetical protein